MKIIRVLIFIIILFLIRYSSVFASDIVLNEVLANPNSQEKEWVEFYNPENIDLTSYWIDDDLNFDDDSGNSSKKNLSSIDTSSSTYPVYTLSSGIFNNSCNPQCDYVVLFSPEGSMIDQFQYTENQINQKGKTFGRSPDGSSNWTILESVTKGGQNSPPNPTATPTLEPTPIPSPTSKPTSTLKPTSTPKPTPTIKASENITRITDSAPIVLAKSTPVAKISTVKSLKNNPTIRIEEDNDNKLAAKKISNEPKTEVLGVSKTNYLSRALIGIGMVLILACGILGFRSWRMKKET